MKNMTKNMKKGIALIIASIMSLSIFSLAAPVTYAGEVVSLDVYSNPSFGGTATAKVGESVSTAYYNNGDTATIKAEARDGYVFIRWRNSSDDTVSSSAEYSFVITEDMDLTAEFGSTVNSDFTGGSGTQNDPYLIDNVENLFMMNSYPDMHFKQTSNIDLKNYTDIDSIGKGGTLFTGTYDGNGKTIKNLTMHRPDAYDSALPESYYVGLFNIGENGVVQNLKIEGASIRATGIAGILAGINQGEIIDCHVEGSVHVTHNNQGAGGLVGENSNIIRDCSAKGDVTGKNELGGLVGKNTCGGTVGSIKDSYADVTVNAYNCGGGLTGINENNAVIETSFARGDVNGDWQLGGLVGINNGEISNCYATGAVNGSEDGEIFGGFTAFNGGLISNSYSIGHVLGTTDAGGFVGINNDDGVIQNCYYDLLTSGKADENKGEPKHTAELLEQNTYNTWDFSNTWTKQSNTYPYFDWQTSNFPTADEVLNAPTLTLEAVESQSVDLSWTEVPGVTEYKVYQGTQTGTYEEVLTASALSCTINELINNTTYYFAVKAKNENSESLYSNEVTATPQEILTNSVTFTVSDAENSPISGAAVSIGGQQKVTDAYGSVVFQLPNGNYSYNISKTGYITSVSLGLSITKDSMYSVTLNYDPSATLTAVFEETPDGGATVGVEMDFDASKSTVAAGDSIVIFAWDFGDGTLSLGELVSHTYHSTGQYTVKLTVTDDKGNKASAEKAINITAFTNQDEQDVLADISALEIADYLATGDTIDSVTENFTVPLVGDHGTTIVWSETSNYVVINPLTGLVEITRPETVNLEMVTINVTVSKGSASDGKGYLIYIPKADPANTTYEKTCVVQNAQGMPLSGASVKVSIADDSFEQTQLTETEGKVIFNLANGNYTINVTLDDYEPLQDTFVITGANNSESFTLNLISYQHTIKVTDSINQPLQGAFVKLDNTALNVHESLTTDSEGKAVFLLANGNYGLSVSKDGYVSDTNGGITVHNTDGTHTYALARNKFDHTFVITDSKNQPLEGALVKLDSTTLNVHESLTTDSEGKAVFLLLANGNYGLSVSKDGYASDTNGGITVLNTNGTHTYALARNKFDHTFVITDNKNQPLTGALVKLDSATLNVHQSLTTDSEGKAVFLLLANGNYGVSVSKEGYVSDTNGGITVLNTDGTHTFSLVNKSNHTGGGNNSLEREPKKENPLLNEPEAAKNSKVEEVAKIKISQELVKKAGDKVSADLSKLDLTKELSSIENKEDEKNALNTGLKPLVNSESKITLNVPADKNAKELEVALPKLEKVFEQVDRVSIESEIASFEIKKDTFGELGNDGIKLSATKLDKESLPENLRESIPEGVNEVIDLNAYVKDQKVSNFNAQIEVSMPYTLKNGEDPEKVCVYLLNDNGQIEKVAGAYNAATGKITVKRKHFSKYFIGVSTDTFGDIQNSWAKHPVEVLAGKGIITGKSGGIYDLNGLTTRAEFVSLIARMLSLEPKEAQGIFKDVHTESWYAQSVEAMYQTGIIKGNPDMTFAPEQTITREEVAVIVSNTLKYLKMNQTDDISDCQFADKDDVSPWATESVSHVYKLQLMNGYPTGDFKPTSNLNRAEMAQIIYKLFNLYNY